MFQPIFLLVANVSSSALETLVETYKTHMQTYETRPAVTSKQSLYYDKPYVAIMDAFHFNISESATSCNAGSLVIHMHLCTDKGCQFAVFLTTSTASTAFSRTYQSDQHHALQPRRGHCQRDRLLHIPNHSPSLLPFRTQNPTTSGMATDKPRPLRLCTQVRYSHRPYSTPSLTARRQ